MAEKLNPQLLQSFGHLGGAPSPIDMPPQNSIKPDSCQEAFGILADFASREADEKIKEVLLRYSKAFNVLGDYFVKSGKVTAPPAITYYASLNKSNPVYNKALKVLEESGFEDADGLLKDIVSFSRQHQEYQSRHSKFSNRIIILNQVLSIKKHLPRKDISAGKEKGPAASPLTQPTGKIKFFAAAFAVSFINISFFLASVVTLPQAFSVIPLLLSQVNWIWHRTMGMVIALFGPAFLLMKSNYKELGKSLEANSKKSFNIEDSASKGKPTSSPLVVGALARMETHTISSPLMHNKLDILESYSVLPLSNANKLAWLEQLKAYLSQHNPQLQKLLEELLDSGKLRAGPNIGVGYLADDGKIYLVSVPELCVMPIKHSCYEWHNSHLLASTSKIIIAFFQISIVSTGFY